MVDQRKWEDLDMDCLVNIMGRLEMESLLLDVPFVCKSWYRATRSPLCWKCIAFPPVSFPRTDVCEPVAGDVEAWDSLTLCEKFMYRYGIGMKLSCGNSFIKFIVNLSQGHATSLRLPLNWSLEALIYVSDVCPELKVLQLPSSKFTFEEDVICKWKHLESLSFSGFPGMGKVFSEISIHCKNFRSLEVLYANVDTEDAIAIASFLPKLQQLNLRNAHITRDCLIVILRSCKELRLLDVGGCVGFDEGDVEILELAAHISSFSCDGSVKNGLLQEYIRKLVMFYEHNSELRDETMGSLDEEVVKLIR